jgi:hypothetical protein
MADPVLIDALIRALLTPVGGIGAGGSTRHVHICAATATTVSWQLDDDYFFYGCFAIGNGGNSWSLNTDGANSGAGAGADNEAGKVKLDTVLVSDPTIPTNAAFFFGPFRTALKKNSKIYLVNGTAFTQSLNVVLQRQQ